MSEDKRDSFGRIQEEPAVFVGGFNNEPGLTPPADDVREALADESDFTPSTEQVRSHYVFDQSNVWRPERGRAFDRWLAAEVRPRGTVTDAEVEAVYAVLVACADLDTPTREDAIIALEAAAEARSA